MSDAKRARVLLAIYFLSGIPGLAAQLAWARVLAAGLGHELPALLGVTTVFLAGLALGARAWDARVSASRHPARWYAGLELFSGAWILLGTPWLSALNEWALRMTGLTPSWGWQWLVATVVPLIAVGPAAVAMGGTFPAMDRVLTPRLVDRRGVALLYAANTAGAVAGIAAAVGWWMPEWGFRRTLGVAGVVQVLCGVGVWVWAGRWRSDPGTEAEAEGEAGVTGGGREMPRESAGTSDVGWACLAAGVFGMGYQWAAVRVLSQVTENTIQSYATMLALYLGGTAAGAGWQRTREVRGGRWGEGVWWWGAGLLVTGAVGVLAWLPRIHDGLSRGFGVRGAEWGVSLVVFVPPALAMGALYSVLVQKARQRGGGVGRASAWNILGAALAGPAVMVGLVPWIGTRGVVTLVAAGYLIVALGRGARSPGRWLLVSAVGVVLAVLPWSLVQVDAGPGGTVVRVVEGPMATVSVVRAPDGHRALRVNNHFQQGGTASAVAARRQGHLPLLLHPAPRRALFLGVGTGISAAAASAHEDLVADGVELLPEVLSVLSAFAPENDAVRPGASPRWHRADARRFVRCSPDAYDVIIADLFHPAEDGAGFLYTREHFEAMRARLAPGGLVCQWVPLHQMDLAVFRDVARTFAEVFPASSLWLLRFNVDVPVLGLVGSLERPTWGAEAMARRMEDETLARALGPLSLNTPLRVLGCLVAQGDSWTSWAARGDLATDDWPAVLFRAPARVYRGGGRFDERPADRLLTLLDAARVDARQVFRGPDAEGYAVRWDAFRRARDLHLRGLADEDAGRRDAAVEGYLASVEASVDYTASYAQAVLVASAFAREKPEMAVGILQRLVAARPDQRLAGEVLQKLGR
ncbi:MAG: hypothetical protein IT580_11980 [Verrucomicrobiales bacterium]|nr:hypothetical protein [Verrucomicrobiales bacterium]